MKVVIPRDIEAEQGLIGCVMLQPNLADEVPEGLLDDSQCLRAITIINRLRSEGLPVNEETVAREMGEGGAAFVGACMVATPSAANFEYWTRKLREVAFRRRLLLLCDHYATKAQSESEDSAKLLETFESEAMSLRRNGESTGEVDIKKTIASLMDAWDAAQKGEKPKMLATGFVDLDRLIYGLLPGNLVILAARPAIGKTTLALNIIDNVCVRDAERVAVFSLEMTTGELIERIICRRAHVTLKALRNHGGEHLTDDGYLSVGIASDKVMRAPLNVVDRGGLTIGQIQGFARRMHQRNRLSLVVLDYLGLVQCGTKRPNRQEEVSIISNGLKSLAKELNVPVLALCQLNRESDKEERSPRLSDLRDSGSIEQDSDAVILMHHEALADGPHQPVRLTVAKVRNGATGALTLQHVKGYFDFRNYAQ